MNDVKLTQKQINQQLTDQIQQLQQQIVELTSKPTKTASKGIGKYVYDLLENPEYQSKTYKELAEIVSQMFDSKTTAGCISWYISHKKDYDRHPLPRLSNK